ncbi:MAG: hypothetical protein ACM3JC_01670 [Rudaea sp.]
MLRYVKRFAAPVALAALLSGCATYDYGYYGYSEPYYGYSGSYSYDYGPYYYGNGPYYYTPGYYYGGPIFDFRYSDRDRHDYRGRSYDHRGRSHDYRGDRDRSGNWNRDRGGNWNGDRGGRSDRGSARPQPTSRTGVTSGAATRQAVPAAPPRGAVTARRDGGREQAQSSGRAPARARNEQRE